MKLSNSILSLSGTSTELKITDYVCAISTTYPDFITQSLTKAAGDDDIVSSTATSQESQERSLEKKTGGTTDEGKTRRDRKADALSSMQCVSG